MLKKQEGLKVPDKLFSAILDKTFEHRFFCKTFNLHYSQTCFSGSNRKNRVFKLWPGL